MEICSFGWMIACAVSLDISQHALIDVRVHSPTVASLKTISRLVSSIHLILKPPFVFSHSENAAWMSLVLSSFGKPVRERMRVTQAESCEREAAMVAEGWSSEVSKVMQWSQGPNVKMQAFSSKLRKLRI